MAPIGTRTPPQPPQARTSLKIIPILGWSLDLSDIRFDRNDLTKSLTFFQQEEK